MKFHALPVVSEESVKTFSEIKKRGFPILKIISNINIIFSPITFKRVKKNYNFFTIMYDVLV